MRTGLVTVEPLVAVIVGNTLEALVGVNVVPVEDADTAGVVVVTLPVPAANVPGVTGIAAVVGVRGVPVVVIPVPAIVLAPVTPLTVVPVSTTPVAPLTMPATWSTELIEELTVTMPFAGRSNESTLSDT